MRSIKAGFTLLEIMVVLLILSMILGLGMGAFSKVGSGPAMALGQIKDVVRTARFHAVRERAPSAIRIDPENNVVVGLGWKNVGCWHFEDNQQGYSSGFPLEAVLGQARLKADGVIGACLDFSLYEGDCQVYLPSAPSFGSVDGVSVECYLYLLDGAPCNLFSKGGAFRLVINEAGHLVATLRHLSPGADPDDPGREAVLESHAYTVPLHRWVKVGFQFNGYTFSLSAEGMVKGFEVLAKEKLPRQRMVRHAGTPLLIGSGEEAFHGYLDELHLSAVVLGEENPFHDEIRLTAKQVQQIHLDAKGMLDRRFHDHPQVIEFIHAERRRYQITVGLMGEVR